MDEFKEFIRSNARVAVQLVYYDHVMCKPIEFDPQVSSTGVPVVEVPVIRVFGGTPAGQQVCLYIHGYLPYFYLPVPDNVAPSKFAQKAHKVLERAARKIVVERRRLRGGRRSRGSLQPKLPNTNDNPDDKDSKQSSCGTDSSQTEETDSFPTSRWFSSRSRLLSQSYHRLAILRQKKTATTAYIHRVDVVEHVIFYGYHTQPRKFLKVHHYNPSMTKHLAGYAFNHGIRKHRLQPYEVHISYLMHFLSDYNLRGMDHIYLSSAIKMRGPLPLHPHYSVQAHPLWQRVVLASIKNTPDDLATVERPVLRDSPSVFLSSHQRRSSCELEVDAHVASILNVFEYHNASDPQSQEVTERGYAVGRYMGARHAFSEQWKQQCTHLQSSSFSPFQTNDRAFTAYASRNTLKQFYSYLLVQAEGLPEDKKPAVVSRLRQLLSQCDDLQGRRKRAPKKTTQNELITISSAFFHTSQDYRPADEGDQYYVYRYAIKPPEVEDADSVDVQDGKKVPSGKENKPSRVDGESVSTRQTNEPSGKGQTRCPNLLLSVKDTQAQTNVMASEHARENNPPIALEPVSDIVGTTDNFECGIALDVITEIDLNCIHANPEVNAINAVVYTLRDHRLAPHFDAVGVPYADVQGAIVVDVSGVERPPPRRINIEEFYRMALIQRCEVDMNVVERQINSGKYVDVSFVPSEMALIDSVSRLISQFDPNVIYGYDMARSSIGYLSQRAEVLGIPYFLEAISRVPPRLRHGSGNQGDRVTDMSTLLTHQRSKLKKRHLSDSEVKPLFSAGRLLFDVADVAVRELNLANLTLENIVRDQFNYVMPSFTMYTMNKWLTTKVSLLQSGDAKGHEADAAVAAPGNAGFNGHVNGNYRLRNAVQMSLHRRDHRNNRGNDVMITPHRFRAIRYALLRNYAVIATFDKLMYFQRYTTFSKLYGLDLKSTIVRGSQYHVESVLIRFTKSFNYVLPSPTRRQVHQQRPSVAIPIVMQPISGFHLAPVAVLDFQSLYSCITIAYNICYSTCLGLLSEHKTWRHRVKLGVVTYHPEEGVFRGILSKHAELPGTEEGTVGVHIMPNGVMFVDKSVREGLLPTMLTSVLQSRRKIKAAMTRPGVEGRILRQWDREQYGLKMLSNLSVGLTASGYSGRMPCSDLAESVVSIARALLVLCMELIHDNFDAEVIYGDTDSIFIKFPGRTVAEAQSLAEEIANKINSTIPEPIKIVPQKVYCPCILVSKKRYLGLIHLNGKMVFDDKGVETMRTSECDATRKILRQALDCILRNRTLDMAYDGLASVFRNVASVYTPKDFILYRQVRLGTYREELTGQVGTLPAAAIVAKHKLDKHYGRRVLENEFIPHVFSTSREDVYRGVKGGAVFPNEINGIFRPTDFVKEHGRRTLPHNSMACVLEQIRRGQPLHQIDVDYYLKKQVLPPLKRVMQLLDIHPDYPIASTIIERLQQMQQRKEERFRRVDEPGKKVGEIWEYTDPLARCTSCGTTCKVKLGTAGHNEVVKDDRKDHISQNLADLLHSKEVRITTIHQDVLSCEDSTKGKMHVVVCEGCRMNPRQTLLKVLNEMNALEEKVHAVNNICLNCTGSAASSASCQNAWHCDVYFKRISYKRLFARSLKEYRGLLTLAYTT
ncbi:DNA polymerase family B family protein, putative [Babesia bigemina]|uniref:DNA polymerase n=1 Tax=Babesia bigemina TaxID=5866 RepID=A0A061CZ45_BABBI|nr:DNA polymerase family B family protein, putative [Babesia bigemina]CDR93896.1 DNA polymerase family B family protein, putative [Babesia bigemina]|eukprot:XP_012766082.1 DNA polymerase family B family protein, putative [Babesia bigemina]